MSVRLEHEPRPFRDGITAPTDYFRVNAKTIKFLALPVIDYLHALQPDAVIAADRGARLLALATHHGWRYRYPGQRFPTIDGKIHLARISRNIDQPTLYDTILFALKQARLPQSEVPGRYVDPETAPTVVLMDDFVKSGATLANFKHAANAYGIPRQNVVLVTMKGLELDDQEHYVADVHSLAGDYEWSDEPDIIGIDYDSANPTIPYVAMKAEALAERAIMRRSLEQYTTPNLLGTVG